MHVAHQLLINSPPVVVELEQELAIASTYFVVAVVLHCPIVQFQKIILMLCESRLGLLIIRSLFQLLLVKREELLLIVKPLDPRVHWQAIPRMSALPDLPTLFNAALLSKSLDKLLIRFEDIGVLVQLLDQTLGYVLFCIPRESVIWLILFFHT